MGQVVQRNFRHSLAGRRKERKKERKNVGGGSHSPPVNALCFRVTKIQIGVLGHSLVRSLVGKWMIRWLFILCFILFWPIVQAKDGGEHGAGASSGLNRRLFLVLVLEYKTSMNHAKKGP